MNSKRVDWKCRTWKWRTIKIARHEIAGQNSVRPTLHYYEVSHMIRLFLVCFDLPQSSNLSKNRHKRLLKFYSDSDVCRFLASFLLCLCVSCNFMPCILDRQFHVQHFQRPPPSKHVWSMSEHCLTSRSLLPLSLSQALLCPVCGHIISSINSNNFESNCYRNL